MEIEINEISNEVAKVLLKIREDKPLIHHITNFVVMNETANITLCAGALPVMAHAIEEVEEMVQYAGALVLNIGTLTPDWVRSMIAAGKKANDLGIPVVLDPVGVGATKLRTESAEEILREVHVSIIRGNPAEISFLAGVPGEIKGVESIAAAENIEQIAGDLALAKRSVVCITGRVDLVTDGKRNVFIENGHQMMSTITGTGCMATTLVAIAASVSKDPLFGATAGLSIFGIAGENAAHNAPDSPGSFHALLYDSLYKLSADDVRKAAKVRFREKLLVHA